MGTTEEQTTYLAQQLKTIQTDVTDLQDALHGAAARYTHLMV